MKYLIAVYCLAIVAANWLVTEFGQPALPLTAFLLIPFDLVVRDLMQNRWEGRGDLWVRMAGVILLGSSLSFLTTTGSIRVASASMVAFTVTGVLDALTYGLMIRYGRILRINVATLLAAVVDSVVFAMIAFDHVSGPLVAAQVGMKLAGGLVWSLVMFRYFKVRRSVDVYA